MTPIKLFCSDLDGTLLGDPESTRRLKEIWESLSRPQRPRLCYNSGRLEDDVISLLKREELPWPDYIIGGLGTQLYDARRKRPVAKFDQQSISGWDLAGVEKILIAFPGVTRQPPEFLHPHKSSWYLRQAQPENLDALRNQLAAAGLEVSMIYSSSRNLDVLPANTSKGHALQWLCESIGIPLRQVLVAGDTGNDSSMFLLPGVKRIMVRNAEPELHDAAGHLPIYRAEGAFAGGVLEGLAHFEVIGKTPSPD